MIQDDEAILAMHDAKMSVDSIAAMMGLRSPCRLAVRLDQLLKARDAACTPAHEPEVAQRIVEAWGEARGRGMALAVSEVSAFAPVRQPAPETSTAPTFINKPPPTAYVGVTPAKLRYARRFIAAGWRLGTTAWLFDLEPEDLAEALAG